MNLLIVDPSSQFHQFLSRLFAGVGITPTRAKSGEAALAALQDEVFDFICACQDLPDMTGLELFHHFRELHGQQFVPYVLLIDEADAISRDEAMRAGVTETFAQDEIKALHAYLQRLFLYHSTLDARVLLVKADSVQRRYLSRLLEQVGSQVSAHAEAESALVDFDACEFDAVVTDIALAGHMSGIGIVNHIRRQVGDNGNIPILAVLDLGDLPRRVELFHLGVNDYILKPVTEVELVQRLRSLIAARGKFADVNDRRRTTQATAQTLLRAIEQVTSAVAIADDDGQIEYANPRFASLVGSTVDALVGQPMVAFDSNPEPLPDQPETREHPKRRTDGSAYWAYETVAPVRDEAGRISHFIAIHDDVSETRELKDQVAYHAMHDHLTGLLNRHELERHLELALTVAHAGRGDSALILLDISHLRMVNDACGYQAGDGLMREIGGRLARHQTNGVLAARVQSGRLALLDPQCSPAEAIDLAETVLQELARVALPVGTQHLQIRIAAGVAMVDASVDTNAEVFRRADTACHVARDQVDGGAVLYTDNDPRIVSRHGARQWLPTLRDALDKEGFQLYSQPISPLRDGDQAGFEILLRLSDGQGGIIGPGHFLPAAEHYGLMPRIDRYVLDHVLDWLAGRVQEALPPYYSINLSGQSLSDQDFLDYALERIRSCGVPPDWLCFEVTESVMARAGDANDFIDRLRRDGCRFAMDDFGSGFASYGQLKQMPVEILKIDGQFVRLIAHDEVDRAMVRSMGDIGRVMGMKTVAEYVEDEATLAVLREIGIDYAQGSHLGRPIPLQET
jgi:diguanylate cyclase (GGDEF)-like protein/PAS domain S-box-containing protein